MVGAVVGAVVGAGSGVEEIVGSGVDIGAGLPAPSFSSLVSSITIFVTKFAITPPPSRTSPNGMTLP
ncbi:hypothetical protein CYJ10_22760 [Cupriavidus pauculus]|uniref:Uncharacterized protein n=1 Tax=Cupriavidus pauculus TaxID=82633 RepID=A0A2N5C7X8_9BURK|nr:hypothetical protein CYJ10_22760 [Cupriavidus pauculus]